MPVKKYTIYSAIKPHLTKEVSIRERKEYLKCKFWKNSKHEAWIFFYCYFPPSAAPSLCRLLLVLSGRLFKAKGFEETLITAWNLSEQYSRRTLDIHSIDDPQYKKIIEAFDDSYPREGLLDDILLWAKTKKLITNAQVMSLRKNIESVRNNILDHETVSETILFDTLNLLIENNLCTPILYHDAQKFLFPNQDLLDELRDMAYYLSNGNYFYFGTSSLMKWLMQQGYLSKQLTEKFRTLKIESIKESSVIYEGRFNSLQKLIQQGADRDDLLYEALQEKPLYWKYPMDCKCKRNIDNHCVCNKGVRWEESKPWVKNDFIAKQRFDGFGQLKKNQSDDSFCCRFGGLAIDMLRHNRLPKTITNHFRIELVPTKDEDMYGLQPYIIISQEELATALAEDRLGFLDNIGSNDSPKKTIIDILSSPQAIQNQNYPMAPNQSTLSKNIFLKKNIGGTYSVSYQGKSIYAPISVGMERFDYVVNNSDKEISALDLAQKFNSAKNTSDITSSLESLKELNQQGINSDPFYSDDERLTPTAIKQYKQRIEYLNEKIEDANDRGDKEKADKLTLEKEQIEDELLKNTNKKGKSRKNKNSNEQARSAVSHSIKNAINQFKETFPELYEHLNEEKGKVKRLQLGFTCIYRSFL